MSINRLFHLVALPSPSIIEFINYWKPFYKDKNEELYALNVNLPTFNKSNLEDLFHWKNGMTLKGSGKKEKAFNDKIVPKIDSINKLKKLASIDIEHFNLEYENVSAVWRIFLLHLIKPNTYPIYDQNIHRTYSFINNLDWQSIKSTMSEKSKLNFYFDTYLPFVNALKINSLKDFDEAFFAFGQFINTRNNRRIFYSKFEPIF